MRNTAEAVRPASPADASSFDELARAFGVAVTFEAEAKAGRALWVLGALGELEGFVSVQLAADEVEVHDLLVRADLRRAGRGQALLIRALGAAAASGARRAYLEFRASNAPARALYERLGFEVLGARARYYADGQDAVLMGVDLPLVAAELSP